MKKQGIVQGKVAGKSYAFTFNYRVVYISLMLIGLLTLLMAIAVSHGSEILNQSVLYQAILGSSLSSLQQHILIDVRLPRLITTIFSGAAFGAAGAIFQSISRNPLGSPDILGFTSGAATGAVFHIVFISQDPLGVVCFTLIGGFISAGLIYVLALRGQHVSSLRLILIGIGVGATLTSLTSLILVKGDLDNAMLATLWLSGSLDGRHWSHATIAFYGCICAIPVLLSQRRALQMAEMGDTLASNLGVNIQLSRKISLAFSVILVSLATAAVGPVAFIALVAPHVSARLIGRHYLPIMTSAFIGALLLLMADLLTQKLSFIAQLPVGRVTAIVGGIYLIGLLLFNSNGSKR
ncbi:MAG: iron chelate uptake ABC transporter family permease subunit [Paraglaciecola sp.]|uniref:FecCD family ABC transporter permease n=1 Tax=Paraglaciecola sp. TaxID=1920173 RepID=UPI003299BA39